MIKVALRDALNEIRGNWQLAEASEVVIADRTSPCELPSAINGREQLAETVQRAAAATKVTPGTSERRSANTSEALVTTRGTIPQEIVAACVSDRGGRRLRHDAEGLPLRISFEDGTLDREAFSRRHPAAAGFIAISWPIYSADHNEAAMTILRFRNGIGGGIFFRMLQRTDAGWAMQWRKTIVLE